jgi:hypothetical protein
VPARCGPMMMPAGFLLVLRHPYSGKWYSLNALKRKFGDLC